MKNQGLIIGVVIIVILVGGFFLFNNSSSTVGSQQNSNLPSRTQPAQTPEWQNFELTDVNSGETFTISQFSDKPVLLESFAVWCPTCTRQQQIIKSLHDEIGESVVSISIDADPNEDASRVIKHTQDNGFNWRYAISPSDLTQLLISEFGTGIINAPSAPMVLICPDGSFEKLDSGVKKVQELKEAVASCNS